MTERTERGYRHKWKAFMLLPLASGCEKLWKRNQPCGIYVLRVTLNVLLTYKNWTFRTQIDSDKEKLYYKSHLRLVTFFIKNIKQQSKAETTNKIKNNKRKCQWNSWCKAGRTCLQPSLQLLSLSLSLEFIYQGTILIIHRWVVFSTNSFHLFALWRSC